MKIKYNLTRGHVWQYYWYARRRRLIIGVSMYFGGCLLMLCLNLVPGVTSGVLKGLALSATSCVIIFTVQFVFLLLYALDRFWQVLKSDTTGERIAEAGMSYLRWGKPQYPGYYHPWSSFEDVVSTEHFFYLILKGKRALIIPKSAFASSREAEEFYKIAHDAWDTAKINERYASMVQEGVWPPPPRIGA